MRPESWRAWDGKGFNARLAGVYSGDLSPGSCAGVGRGSLFEIGSLSYDRTSGLFVYLGAISIGKPGATMMACEQKLMTHEAAFFDMLEKVASFKVEDGGLLLSAGDGRALLRFAASAS